MRSSGTQAKRFISLALCLAMLVSAVAFALTVNAEEVTELAGTGADTYYLWGESTNSPNFSGSTPTGTFTYDSSKGYYYYDLSGSSNDYCFVVSTVSNSANNAVKTPAVSTVGNGGDYYLSVGNYHGFNCMHLWNPRGDTVRIYFSSTTAGLNVVKAGAEETQPPTQAPTQPQTQKPTSGGGTNPTTAPSTQYPTSSSDKRYVYCENEEGWSSVYAYLWNSNSDKNLEWPGVEMTNIGGNIWRYEVPKTFAKIIFNIGSNQTQTTDMAYPGDGYCYNNKTKEWYIYDTSPLQVTSFVTDLASPQYNGVGITLAATAEGSGKTYYKFSVQYNGGTTVLADYSTKNYVLWTPQTPGTYTIIYDFKDDDGVTNRRTKEYIINDGLTSALPYIKTVTPAGGQILKSSAVNLSVAAGGGITGTNLLFYKFTVRNANGAIINVPYYSLRNTASFTPTATGAYTVTVSVQGSDNKLDERTYSYECVTSISPTEGPYVPPTENVPATQAPTQPQTQKPTQAPTQKPTQAPTQPPTQSGPVIIRGDADDDGEVGIFDVTYIQRYDLNIKLPTPINLLNADADDDGDVSILDATLVQRFLAGIIKSL